MVFAPIVRKDYIPNYIDSDKAKEEVELLGCLNPHPSL